MATIKQKIGSNDLAALLRKHGLFAEAQKFRVDKQTELEASNTRYPAKLAWIAMQAEYLPRVQELELAAGVTPGTSPALAAQVDTFTSLLNSLSAKDRSAFQKLRDAALLKPTTKPGRQMDWAFNNWPLDWEQIDPAGVPDVGALGSLLKMKSDDKVHSDCLTRRASTSAQMQKEQDTGGDDGNVSEMFEQIAGTLVQVE